MHTAVAKPLVEVAGEGSVEAEVDKHRAEGAALAKAVMAVAEMVNREMATGRAQDTDRGMMTSLEAVRVVEVKGVSVAGARVAELRGLEAAKEDVLLSRTLNNIIQ